MFPIDKDEPKEEKYENWLVEFVDKRDGRKYRYLVGVKMPALVSVETIILRGLVELFPHVKFSEFVFHKVYAEPFEFQGNMFSTIR